MDMVRRERETVFLSVGLLFFGMELGIIMISDCCLHLYYYS
jgi:hypothetical protein